MSIDVHVPQRPEADVFYPETDGEPMGETEVHILAIFDLLGTLRRFFWVHPDIYVIADMFLYYEKGNPNARKAPDVMIVKGVDTSEPRRIFKTWEEKAVPCVIVEFTSLGTKHEDQVNKRALYARLGVEEYFLFDPLHEYLEEALIGYRLHEGEYQKLTATSDGSLISEELGLRLSPERRYLRVYDLATGERVVPWTETWDWAEQEHRRAEEAYYRYEQERCRAELEKRDAIAERNRAEEQQRQAEAQQQRAEAQQQRAEAAEAEVARLRDLLRQRDEKKE